ncbi:hypothetical protein JXA88_09690 [Candidatus Fermentibacteria bacterium]|nr:hypothetical protein [Candidatus Fermentibacteria bacterium]
MIDLHVHLLPGLDDGCGTLEETVALANYLTSEGIKHAVATVHHLPGVYEIPPETVSEALTRTREALEIGGIPLEVTVANEIMIQQGLAERVRSGELTGIGKMKHYALVEFSSREIPWFAFTTLEHMTELGVIPIVAHPERCYPLHRDIAELRAWYSKGILAQLDLGSLLGIHGTRVQRFAEYLVRNHLIHLLGSDLHSPPPIPDLWARAYRRIAKLGGQEYACIIADDLPRAVLEDEDIGRIVPSPRHAKRYSLGTLASSLLGYASKD